MLKKIENNINNNLQRFPFLKKIVKRTYQLSMYTISSKEKSSGALERISPDDDFEYFFGYYDKSPWDASERYMLCLRAKNTYTSTAPKESAEIILFDTEADNSYQVLGHTKSWNVQQGGMLQWLGPDYKSNVLYNDFRDGEYCSVIMDITTKQARVISMPVYSVSKDGNFALSLDFSRLHRLRKGYGYSNLPDVTKNQKCPDEPCIWHVNLSNGSVTPLMNYTDFNNFEHRPEMDSAEHKVNHIMLNPSGDRFMVLHRWLNGTNKFTRLVTVNIDGSNMYNLNDDNMTSHCYWKNDSEILAYARKKEEGDGYYLLKDQTQKYERLWPELTSDGHPSYSPDGSMVVTDTYPDKKRMANLYCISENGIDLVARVFAPFKYDNDFRCDLHPKWDWNSKKVSIDAVFEGKRALYVVKIIK